MPELPEVEIIRVGLEQLLHGKQVKKVWSDWPKSFPNTTTDVEQFLLHAQIEHVQRRAKVLMVALDTGYSLIIHLKMTGQLVYRGETQFGAGHPNSSLVGPLPDKSTRVIIEFTDGSKLFFNDQRKFGWMRLLSSSAIEQLDFFKKLGPEPLLATLTSEQFRRQLVRRSKTSIKAALLDQSIIAGVGNIYADESLWEAKIHPATRVANLSQQQIRQLLTALRKVLLLGIEKGGSTDRTYVNAEGRKGSYLTFAQVFRREGLPCSRCGTVIIKLRVAGRGTHICPFCQKEPKT